MHHSHSHHDRDRRFARRDTAMTMLRSVTDGHGYGGRSGLGRFFAHGDLRLVILHLSPKSHATVIIKAIEEQVGGTYSPSPGVIYRRCTMLEELGHVTVSAGDGGRNRCDYRGRPGLPRSFRPAVAALLARMEEANRVHGGGPAPQIVRAMENMKLALRLRLSRGPLSEEQIHAVAAAIDGAAISVERV